MCSLFEADSLREELGRISTLRQVFMVKLAEDSGHSARKHHNFDLCLKKSRKNDRHSQRAARCKVGRVTAQNRYDATCLVCFAPW